MLLLSAAAKVHVSGPGKLLAVVIGLAVLGAVWLVYQLATGSWAVWRLANGQDRTLSTSKLQWFVWLAVIVFSYTVLWVARASGGDYTAISDIPTNVLAVLGLSTGSAVLAKGITSSQVGNGHVAKITAEGTPPASGALLDDAGEFDLGKVQMVAFTVIAVLIYLATVLHRLRSDPVNTALPNIDSSLLVLMGVSHGGYLGKKLVTKDGPMLYAMARESVRPGSQVTLQGVGLGTHAGCSELLLDGEPVAVDTWSTKCVRFTFPEHPAGGGAWTTGHQANLKAVVDGRVTNAVTVTVAAA